MNRYRKAPAIALATLGALACYQTPARADDTADEIRALKAQLKKLDNLLADDGVDQLIPPDIMAKLGLAQRVVKQLGVVDKQTSDLHAYARLRDGGILFTFVDFAKTKLAYTYRLDPAFKVVASVAMAKTVASDIADPEAGAKAELAYWAQVADQL